MKILVIVPYFEEPHRWMISGQRAARSLSGRNQVTVLTTGRRSGIEQVSPNLKIIRLKDIFLRDPINYSVVPGLSRAIKQIVQQENPDAFLINKHMFYTSLAIWPLKRLGKRVVIQTDTFPGINWQPRSKLVGIIMSGYARVIGNPILRAADEVVLLHEGLLPVAKKLGLNHTVIHNGVDIEQFDQVVRPKDLKKKKGEIWIGYVGRLESVKGWYDLAAVARRLVKKDDRLHFFFIGPFGNAREQVESFRHPRLHFLGLRHDVAGIDKLLDIFVMPSLSEGLSNAIMEAMAAECACVVSNVGGNIILIKNGENGLSFKVGNQRDLQSQLWRLVGDPSLRRRLGRAARQTIEAEYSLQTNMARLEQTLHHG